MNSRDKKKNDNIGGCKIAVLQLKHDEQGSTRRFIGSDRLKKYFNEIPNSNNYDLIYARNIVLEDISLGEKKFCEKLYSELNNGLHPGDYYGYSPSVSDVIVIYNGEDSFKSYYIESIGLQEFPGFLSEEMKNRIKEGLDIRKELNQLTEWSKDINLPEEYEVRKAYLKEFSNVFKMADERAKILGGLQLKAINIEWDTDGDMEVFDELPTEIEIPIGMTDEDEISDYLSDVTGFCHKGFIIEVLINETERNSSHQRNLEEQIKNAKGVLKGEKGVTKETNVIDKRFERDI